MPLAKSTERLFRKHHHNSEAHYFPLCQKPSVKKRSKVCLYVFPPRFPRQFGCVLICFFAACKECGLAPIHNARQQAAGKVQLRLGNFITNRCCHVHVERACSNCWFASAAVKFFSAATGVR